MKKISVRIRKKTDVQEYRSSWNGLGGSVTITDGKVSCVSFYQDGGGGVGYAASPGDSSFSNCRYDIFGLMCRHDTENFKSMLRFIENTDPENYNYGCSLLEAEKAKAIRQAQSASSKFDL